MSELKACDLYGGKEKVIKALTDAVKEAWPRHKDKSDDIARDLAYLDVSQKAIDKVMAGEALVDYGLFERLGGWLELNIWKIIGDPQFDECHGPNSMAEWALEMERDPMFSTGPAMTMGLYVSCRLVSEIGCGFADLCHEWWRPTSEEVTRHLEKARNG